jgi:hypothetical protein
MTRTASVFWLEKIASLLLAAYLEEAGWSRVMLSVPPRLLADPSSITRTDWARSVKAALLAGRPFTKGELKLAHDRTSVPRTERLMLRRGLRAILEDLVGDDLRSPYRYDGIWHDDGGNVDLVAWAGDETLTIEAKGITLSGAGYSQAAAESVTAAVAERVVGREWATRSGWLLPDDRDFSADGKGGFVATLLARWPSDAPDDERAPIFLAGRDGRIRETTRRALTNLRAPTSASPDSR